MAVTAKSFPNTNAQEKMVKALVSATATDVDPITKIAAKTTSGNGLGSYSQGITFNAVSGASVTMSGTPLINVAAGVTINFIELHGFDNGVLNEYTPLIVFAITAESFPYAGSITITSCTLSISNTIS